ncbi:endo-1,4-beta-xylanase A precursor [Ruminiclostridium hungatei]|uniref:Endo-1,4-beta-xylanase A n=1 Tax=Ruminiclostridium hungatei TaxID=48256 RepID=A0A1V4SHU3_RUMHU|nr:S-layer homology domain-containing protein [Ruminiclostridium hungatei]OPX42807.1 endo-1,4-beta-xylanase A precursor [Ruminiclostridium hungatei]
MYRKIFKSISIFLAAALLAAMMAIPGIAAGEKSTTGDNVVRMSAAGAMSIVVEMLGANLSATSATCLNGTSMPQLFPTFAINNENPDPYLANFVNKRFPATVEGWNGSGPGTPVYDGTKTPPTSPVVSNQPDIVGGFSETSTPTLKALQAVYDVLYPGSKGQQLISPASAPLTTKDGIIAAVKNHAAAIETIMKEYNKTTRYSKKPTEIANEFAAFYNNNVETVQKLIKGAPLTTVVYIQSTGTGVYNVLAESSNDIFATYHIGIAGGKNVGKGSQMTGAQIEEANPDVIVTGSAALTSAVKADTSLAGTAAFDSGKIYTIPTGVYGWHLRSPESCLAPLWLGKILHPDKTASLNINTKVYNYYKDLYHYDTSPNAKQKLKDVVLNITGFSDGILEEAVSEVKSGTLVPYTVKDGKDIIIKLSAVSNNKMYYSGDSTTTYQYKDNKKSFKDISTHWAKDYIEFVAARELLGDTGGGNFSPNSQFTRGMLAAVLGKLCDAPVVKVEKSRFSDVPENKYYAPYIEWAVETGIMDGAANNKFGPDLPVSREEMAVIITNFAKAEDLIIKEIIGQPAVFSDESSINDLSKDSINTVQKAGIMSGKANNKFDPKGKITRAETAVILSKLITNVVVNE